MNIPTWLPEAAFFMLSAVGAAIVLIVECAS